MTDEQEIPQGAKAASQEAVPAQYEADECSVPEAMLKYIRSNIRQDINGGKALLDGV